MIYKFILLQGKQTSSQKTLLPKAIRLKSEERIWLGSPSQILSSSKIILLKMQHIQQFKGDSQKNAQADHSNNRVKQRCTDQTALQAQTLKEGW